MQINNQASKQREISTPPVIDIELLALDLNRCTRCVGTLDHIEKAIEIIRPVLEVMEAQVNVRKIVIRNFHFELPLHPKTYACYPVVSTANSSGLFEVVVGHILAVLRSRCAGFACPACLAADTYPARPLLST